MASIRVGNEILSPLILVSDDDSAILDLLRLILERAGYRVARSQWPYETLELAGRLQPDLITTDIMKPEMDGIEMIRRLGADPASRHIPVVVVSACAITTIVQAALEAGAVCFLYKPFLPSRLATAVASILAHPAR